MSSAVVELQPLNLAPDSADTAFGSPSPLPQHSRRYSYHHHRSSIIWASLTDTRNQKRIWLAAAGVLVALSAVVFVAVSTKHAAAPSQTAAADTSRAFPAEPYLAPSSACQLDALPVGPELQLAVPLNYHLQVNLSDPAFYQPGDATGRVAAGFGGAVNITLNIVQDAPCISLHARNLSFSSITARLLGAAWKGDDAGSSSEACLCGAAATCLTNVCARLFKARPGSDAWVLSLGRYVAPAGSTMLLQARYTAAFGVHGEGLWRSAAYPSAGGSGQQVVALSTAFEITAARSVLPCLDEPRYKATFVVEVEAPSDLAVLSNSPSAATRWTLSSASSSVSRVTFQPSPPMATYLLSIAVGELKGTTGTSSSGQSVRVWTTPGSVAAAAMPLQLAVAALDHYQRLTGMLQSSGPKKKASTKWDLLAVPGKSGAVENWHLLMMDPERFLLTSPAGAWDLFRCANVICHELAHQWFGNLVTAATWQDLLHNEGLATLAEYGCMAAVLPQQVGLQGAAVLMRGMAGAPAGVKPGVHEGPFERTLTYDASPLAQPLLGAPAVDFDVPVYSKAAALMAVISNYADLAAAQQGSSNGTTAASQQLQLQFGPVADLRGSTPPSPLQEALRQHLQQHAYSSATAQETLARIVQLAPPELSSNTLAVLTGWQSPGSPLIELQPTPQGLKLTQRRFCAWGLLQEGFVTRLLAAVATGTAPAQLPTPAAGSTGAGSGGPLFCPTALEGQDRAVPWTPVRLTLLPSAGGGSAAADSSNSSYAAGSSLCGQWVVVSKDEQLVPAPAAAGCPDAAAATAQHSPGYVLDGAGGWGVFRSLYPAEQRAALRQWVVRSVQQPPPAGAAAANSTEVVVAGGSSLMSLEVLLSASKVLQDQAALSLSAFGEGQGDEVGAVLQAAVDASKAAAAGAVDGGSNSSSSSGQPPPADAPSVGFGTVLYSLLAPVVPAAETLLGRLSGDRLCWLAQQERLAVALAPVAAAALSAFAPPGHQQPSSNATAASNHHTPDQFLGAMALNRLLTATALVDAETAYKLCSRFNAAAAAAAAAAASPGRGTASADALLSHIHPDLQHAVLDVAAAQPPGCQLDWAGDKLYTTLREWHLAHPNPRVAAMAAFALSHFPARGLHSAVAWTDTLSLLLALNTSTGAAAASGISPAKHAAELAVLVSRAVTLSKRFPQPEIAPAAAATSSTPSSTGSSPGAVLAVLLQLWPHLVARMGEKTAWDVLREVAAREVLTEQQWQALAAWAAQQVPSAAQGGAGGAAAGGAAAKLQQRRVQALLGAAWSTVAWVKANRGAVCRS